MPEYESIDVGAFVGDPTADDLRTGGQKTNNNLDKSAPTNVSYSTLLDFSANKEYAARTISGIEQFSLGSSFIRGGQVRMTIQGDGELKLPAKVRLVSGFYDPEKTNRVEMVNVGGPDLGSADIVCVIRSSQKTPSTGLVFRHFTVDQTDLLTSFTEALNINKGSGNPAAESQYSRLEDLESLRAEDGYFYFRLRYFRPVSLVQTGSDIVWRQRTNMTDQALAYENVDGYQAISGTAQLTLIPVVGDPILFGGMAISSIGRYAYWHGHPGSIDPAAAFSATLGTNLWTPDFPGIPTSISGILPDEGGVELYVENPL